MDLLRSLPIGLYLEKPVTWLHRVDPRMKFAWLMAFLLTPIAASPFWRLSLAGWALLLMLSTRLPFRVWWKQMGLVTLFSLLLFCVTVFAPDGLNVSHQPRLPIDEFAETASIREPEPVPELPQPTDYRYIMLQQGPLRVTRRSLDLATRVGTLIFTLLASTNLYLLTTAPEEVTASIEQFLRPLNRFGLPVSEVVLTLTLALRFIPLVLEEIQNLVRSVRTRAINWKKLGFRGSTQVGVMVSERLVDNLLVRAEQTATAMQVRGFANAQQHRLPWHQLRFRPIDGLVFVALSALIVARVVWGGMNA
ncbi:energy-coupling factor transporter transmembrane component T family protein [Leptolyngbya sp. AN02str]|uniref:energy-coupling factor transporter transmembrane component T family protein n=1 Tax=Leptolyngbya sp. AN02str TaxID=3423363 RepID=UPI003D323160